ncbi:ACP S-malonyltransferase [Kitasatospora sp. NPDC004240]
MRPNIPPFTRGLTPADLRPRPADGPRTATAVLLDPQSRINPGEHRELYETVPEVRERLALASELVGHDLAGALLDGTDEEVNRGVVARPVVVALSVALYHRAMDGRPRPAYLAGLSLGQITAAHLAGCMSFEDAVRMCHTMASVEEEAYGGRPFGVSFFHNADPVELTALMTELDEPEAPLRPCAYVADDQMIVSGGTAALGRLAERALGLGALGLPIPYGPPAHCDLLAGVQEEFAARWRYRDGLADPTVPLICNLIAEPLTGAAAIGAALVGQYTRPVRWADSLYRLASLGVGALVVPGPGRFLHRSLESLAVRFDTVGPDQVLAGGPVVAGAVS